MGEKRELTFIEAVRDAFSTILLEHENAFIMGQGVNDTVGMFGGTTDLWKEFGAERVFDTPLAETGLTGVAVGAALGGMRPIYCHNRQDFLMLAMDQLINHAAKFNYMSGGSCPVPLLIWAVTNEGWGAAAQHSQSVHGLFMHIPGLKIIMPTTPYDVKGMLLSAAEDNNPILFLDHRRLHRQSGEVPAGNYKAPIGKGAVLKEGTDITIIGISIGVPHALNAAAELEKQGISCEIIDLRTVKPYDKDIIVRSVEKTGRLLIVDNGWRTDGAAAEIGCEMGALLFGKLKAPIDRVTWPDVPAPASYALEELFFINEKKIVDAAVKSIRYGMNTEE